jgi:hypothetical protein
MHQTVIATLYQHRAQSCTQTEEALKELHIQHILHEMFQQMRVYGQSCVLARSWQLYSCRTALSIENQDNSELPQEREVYSLVFSEFVAYIMETKTSSDNSVVFALQMGSHLTS